jgi:hypothetical protein
MGCIIHRTSLRLPSQDGFDSCFFAVPFAGPIRIDHGSLSGRLRELHAADEQTRDANARQTQSTMNQSMIDAILDGPALAPPPGVRPNFENPDNLSHPELAWLQLIIATVVVVMRVYTKLGVVRNMLAEDCESYRSCGLRMYRGGISSDL